MRSRWAALALAPLAACGLQLTGTGPELQTGAPERSPASDAAEGGSSLAGGDAASPDAGGDASPDADVDAGTDAGDAGRPYDARVTSGLVALWEFEENGGSTVHDSVAPQVDLTIDHTSRVTWRPHALRMTDYTSIGSGSTDLTKAFTACDASNEVTMEAWVASDQNGQDDYSRILTMASGSTSRDFALGAYRDDTWWASMRSSEDLEVGTVTTSLTHVVATRDASGTLTLYADAVSQGTRSTNTGAGWTDYPFTIGNTPTGGKGWLGTIHLVALYCRALSAAEVHTNFAAGPDP